MRIMFVGDINLGEYYTAFGHGPRNYLESNDIFHDVKEVLNNADIVVGNLEAPLTNYNYKPESVESAVLRGNPKHASCLSSAGFKLLQVANNHSVQHGAEGFEETITTLKDIGIKPVGIKNQAMEIVEAKGQTIGFLAASDVPDNTDTKQSCYQILNSAFLDKVSHSVELVDHLFIMLHWGLESSTEPLPYQRKLISELSDLGVRGVIGSHPHLFYEIWRDRNTIAAPSLGNFVFDLFWDTRLLKSGILDIELGKQKIESCQIWPISISKNGGRPCLYGPGTEIETRLNLYDLGENMNGEQARKLIRFFLDFRKGNSKLKARFFTKKIFGKL